MKFLDPAAIEVIAPNLKRRISGVTSTVIRLVPIQAREINIAATGPALPDHVPQIRMRDLLAMPRRGPSGPRVWHARRNTEMLAGLLLRYVLRKDLRLLFTSASQRRHSRYTRWLIRRMDAVIATSDKTAGYLERPATVIRHGIDTANFVPPADRRTLRLDLGLDPDIRIVSCIGRIRPSKGTDLFVDAMIDLLPRQTGWQALIIGGVVRAHAAFARELQDRIAAAGLTDRIRFLPEVPPWDIDRWFGASDLYVAPQRSEGFGLTPLEAMACGCPVIATDAGAFEELIAANETGLIVPAGDGVSLTRAIGDAMEDPDRLARWSAAGPPHVARHFRLADEAAAITAVYRSLLSR